MEHNLIDDLAVTSMPPRSELYCLPMRGTCGANQESILDYAQRLSVEHSIGVRRMFSTILLPKAGLGQLCRAAIHPKTLLSLNGTLDNAKAFLASLERLTGRSDLENGTMLRWRELFRGGVGHSAIRRWCPDCLEVDPEKQHPTFSLLWTIGAASVCPLHKVRLEDRCGKCGKAQAVLGDAGVHGCCSGCRSRLQTSRRRDGRGPPTASEMFAAEAIAEMISAEPADCSLATADHYRARLRQVAVDLCGGSIYKLTKELNFSKGVLNRSGGISLTQFLAVIHRLGVGPIAFLKATAEPFIDPDAVGTRHVRYSKASVKDLGVVERRLTELVARLAKQPDTPVPVESLARKLEVPTRTLRLKFPEALAVLRKHNEEARPAARLVKLESQKVAACAAMRDLVARCGSTRGRSIQAALAEAGVPWVTPELRAFARTELHKLLALSR